MPPRPRTPPALALLAAALVVLLAGCTRHDGEGENTDETATEDGGVAAFAVDAARPDATDAAPARDARTDEERAAITDAGRSCGEKDLPDCPLQAWMKRNANTMIKFGEITTLAEVFDQIAALAPPATGVAREAYPNWASIARDGAAASRAGNIPAARASCRGCHTQYRARYHADLRGLGLPALPQPTHP